MHLKEINTWWEKGITKERARFSNAPKSPKSNKTLVPETFSTFAPPLTFLKKPHAR